MPRGQRVVCGLPLSPHDSEKLTGMGFSPALQPGESLLPPAKYGPVSRFNANGAYIVHRDQPMETAYRTVEWHWTEWRGRYDTEEQSKFVDVPYKRYPRTLILPPSVELQIAVNKRGRSILVSPALIHLPENEEQILHNINLFLEIFGRCQIFTGNLDEIIESPLRQLNWRILPPGQRPWGELQRELKPLVQRAKRGNQVVIDHRLETINRHHPEFVAVGHAGFAGYIVFGFPQRTIFVLESIYTGNATYVFDDRWENLSRRTKAEILNENLQTDRIIHREGWERRIARLLQPPRNPAGAPI